MAEEEAKAAKAEDAEAGEEEGGGKSKKKLIILIAAAVTVIGGASAGAFLFLSGGSDEMAAKSQEGAAPGEDSANANSEGEEKNEGDGESPGEGAKPESEQKTVVVKKTENTGINFGCTHTFKTFNLNLGNPLENRYIRMELSIEFGCNEETDKEIKRRLPQLEDAIIGVTRRKTREFLLGPDGLTQLRKEIRNRVNHFMSKPINDVYITDILIE
jgi:flagellar protein FliL